MRMFDKAFCYQLAMIFVLLLITFTHASFTSKFLRMSSNLATKTPKNCLIIGGGPIGNMEETLVDKI